MEWEIQLNTARLKNWNALMEQSLTEVRDFLDILEVEAESLKSSWEGEAMSQWKMELFKLTNTVRKAVQEMEKLVLMVEESASVLARMETDMTAASENISVE